MRSLLLLLLVGCGTSGSSLDASPEAAAPDACTTEDCVTELASGQKPTSIAVDKTNVYWTNDDGSMWAAPNAGGSPVRLAPVGPKPYSVVLDEANVYWSRADGTIVRCAKAGCAMPTLLVSDLDAYVSLSIRNGSIYWVNAGLGNVGTCSVDGGATTILATNQDYPTRLATSSTTLYWVNTGGFIGHAVLQRCTLSGCTRITEVLSGQTIDSFVLDATNVYWTDPWKDGGVRRCALAGCTAPETLAFDQRGAYDLVGDGNRLYWVSTTTAAIMTCGSSSCTPTTFVNQSASVLALDEGWVYWARFEDGTIRRHPR